MPVLRLLKVQLKTLDSSSGCSIFVLMLNGHALSSSLPDDIRLSGRFWYWRGASGQTYIHSIYARDLSPPVPGAIFVIVHRCGSVRRAICAGQIGADGKIPDLAPPAEGEEEIHLHLLARDAKSAIEILRDIEEAMSGRPQPAPERTGYSKPVQLELLLAA